MEENHGKFLRYVVDSETYQFNCLPLSLSSPPWVFIKILKPVAALLRELDICQIICVNDILLLPETKEKMTSHILGLVFLLEHLGFVVNSDKSVLYPTQEIKFLGLCINLMLMELKLPLLKVKMIRAESNSLMKSP